MKAFVFPGQGAQFVGMGKDLYDQSSDAKRIMDEANDVLGWSLTDIMFDGTKEELRQTKVTQPAIFVQSIATFAAAGANLDSVIGMAGHSLGEFTALVAAKSLAFADGLKLVSMRALAMQAACESTEGTMAAVLGLDDEVIESVCKQVEGVVPANYNSPGQLVISGTLEGVAQASELLKEKGARRVLPLPVGGAFHSPLMKSAEEELGKAINATSFDDASVPIYQNVTTVGATAASDIKFNLLKQLTASVRWTQSIKSMVANGITEFVEVGGNGKVLGGMIKKIDSSVIISNL